jgi:hypothetical protein
MSTKFTTPPSVPAPSAADHPTRNDDGRLSDARFPSNDASLVHSTGNENVGGVKTFTDAPLVPTPVSSGEAANKSYIDDQIGAAGAVLSQFVNITGGPPAGTPGYLSWASGANTFGTDTAQLQTQLRAPRAGTLKSLFVDVATAPGGADTYTFTARKAFADTALAVVITGAAVAASDVADQISVAQGEILSVRFDHTGATLPGRVNLVMVYA